MAETEITYAYLAKAHRIFSDHNRAGNSGMDYHLLNLAHSGFDSGKPSAYSYWPGFDDGLAIRLATATRTIGMSFDGSEPLSKNFKLIYRLELADQADYDQGAAGNHAKYQFAELGFAYKKLTLKIGKETLEGDGSYGFATQWRRCINLMVGQIIFWPPPKDGLQDRYL
ncbi:MAG: hypothetical protein JKY89_05270, partial [Immundisolibacteraceae bacterium]|nr:hypothetical protein [Immundisolibacteraceae bacterium]